ncbi:MAG: NAD(P)/FAD-dependent oxidoreductase [Nitrospiria bacterium]
MDCFDVVIVGAGPAGGEAARRLSNAGFKILLAEKESSFAANDFSSGGAPLEILSDFDLPRSAVGAFCHQIKITTSHDAHRWQGREAVALVLDFQKLRSFLADETTRNGSAVRLGWAYRQHETKAGRTRVHFKPTGQETLETIETRVLIDATGSERRVLMGGQNTNNRRRTIVGRGIEYLIEVPKPVYQAYADCLSFYIGAKWMPQGYAWIFPMKNPRLKIGVGRNYPAEQVVPHARSMKYYLDQLIRECLKCDPLRILDKHGKTIVYTRHQRDLYAHQNIIAVGDAVSTVNPLTFEGIRHALKSGEIAARHTQAFLEEKKTAFQGYATEMRRYCGLKWVTSEILTEKTYREPDDDKMTMMLHALKNLPLAAFKNLFFDYSFKSAVRFYADYQWRVFKRALGLGRKSTLSRGRE